MLARPVKELPRLEAVLSKSAGLSPMQLKAGGPRAPEPPKWSARPSKAGTATELAPQWKAVPVILTTGRLIDDFAPETDCDILAKPFTESALLDHVRRFIGEA